MSDKEPNAEESAEYTLVEEEALDANLDPRLQNVVISSRTGAEDDFRLGKLIATGRVDVIAQLADPDQEVEGLTAVQKTGHVVTGTVEIKKIEAVNRHPNVVRLEKASKLYPSLDRSVYEIRAHREQLRESLPAGTEPFDGSGVIIGIVDHDCDFTHLNFRQHEGYRETRLLFLWDQNGEPSPSSTTPYGRELDGPAINEALRKSLQLRRRDDAFRRLDYRPAADAHGTRVTDVAAGNGRGTGSPGVAPKADIIFVHLASEEADEPETFGNSRRLMDAVKYIVGKADQANKQAVINISLNGRDGPHDGSTLAEKYFDDFLKTDGRAIVIASGRFRTTEGHASGELQPGQSRVLGWEIQQRDETDNELEIWYGGKHELVLTLVSPAGEPVGSFPLGKVKRLSRQKREVARVFHGRSYTDNGDHLIKIIFTTKMEPGRWGLALRSLSESPVTFHAWIAGDGRGQSRFAQPDVDLSHTLGAISCGKSTLVVGAYDPLRPHESLPEASEGPTRDNKQKPEVSAPGVNITAAAALSDSRPLELRSGTSLAAPHVAGLIALLMQASGGVRLTTEQIREAVISSARTAPPDKPWDPLYGHGRVDALAAVQKLLKTPSPTSASKGENAMEFNFNFPPATEALRSTLRDGEEVDHPPIIITDGSAIIEFDAEEYPLPGGSDEHVSAGLSLGAISAINKDQVGHFCPALPLNRPARIVVTLQGPQALQLIINGANSRAGGSPRIRFDHSVFPQVTSLDPEYQKYFGREYRITRMEIFLINAAGVPELHHDCPFVNQGNCYRITIVDPHVAPG
jgi:subtilisin family serine protease